MSLINRVILKAKALRRRALLGNIYERMKPFTMIPKDVYIDNLELISKFSESVSSGAVVECGIWRGGMLGGIGILLQHSVPLHGADSFRGLPAAKEIWLYDK